MSVDYGNIESSSGEPSKLITQRIQVADANVGGAQVAHSNLPGQVDDDLVNQPVTAVGGNKHSPMRASDRGNKISHDEPLKRNGGSGNNTDLDKNVKSETLDFAEPARQLALDISAIDIPVLPLVEEIVQHQKILKPLPGAKATTHPAQINKWFEDLIGVRSLVATAHERIEKIRNIQQKYWQADREMERAAKEFHECGQLIEIGRRVLSGEIDLDTATDLLPSLYSWCGLDEKKAICRKATREIERNQARSADANAKLYAATKAKSEIPSFQYNDAVRVEEEKINAAGPTDIAGVRITGGFSVLRLSTCCKDWFAANPSHSLPETLTYRGHYVFILNKEPLYGDVGPGRISSPYYIDLTPTDEVMVRPVATEPDWVLDAWWGEDCRGTPLDTAAAVAKAKAYLAEAEREEDKPKSAAYIASLVREWRDDEKSEEWIREKIQELENYEPEYEVTIGHIRHLRDCGLSKPRANRLISLWNQNNRPPLPVEKLRGLVSLVWEDTEILYIAREQRWRYRDTGPEDGSLESLLDEPLAPDDFLMGRVLSTDQRAMLFGPTGKGKTVVALAIGIHVAAGHDFLHWKGPGKPRRVLVVDGEMGRKGMRLRIEESIRRLGMRPPKGMLTVISKEQFPQLRLGLDTLEGQLWLDGFVEKAGGFDLIIFDNINTLCSGDTIGPEGWKRVDEWSLDFKAMGIGQLWVHHTGHNTGHEYGTVIRRNDMDTVIRLRPLQANPERRSFALDFEKARFADRAPADFETVQINLAGDTWQTSGGPNPTADRVELLRAALIEHGAISSETGLSEAEFAKRLSDDPTEQETWRNRLHVYFRRPAYGQLCGLVPVAGKQARSWWAKDEEIN